MPAGAVKSEAPGARPAPSSAPLPKATPQLPVLRPGETVTWVKVERPRLALGQIVVGSFAIVGVLALLAIGVGIAIGQIRSRRAAEAQSARLDLR